MQIYLEEWMPSCMERRWMFFSSIVLCDKKYLGKNIVGQETVKDLLSRLGIMLHTKITEPYKDCDDGDLPGVIILHAQLQNIVVERGERLA